MRRVNLNIGLAFAMLLLSALACAFDEEMGDLIVGSQPFPFVLRGEVDNTWQVSVVPNKQYMVILRRQSSSHPLDQLAVSVVSAKVSLAETANISGDSVTVRFLAPSSGQVTVRVYSKIGERQENLGRFTIQVEETKP